MNTSTPPCARITLRKASTGQVVSFIDDWSEYAKYAKYADYETVVFQWEENNNSCDDNRERYFYRALGEPCPEQPEREHFCMRIGPHRAYEYELVSIEPAIPGAK